MTMIGLSQLLLLFSLLVTGVVAFSALSSRRSWLTTTTGGGAAAVLLTAGLTTTTPTDAARAAEDKDAAAAAAAVALQDVYFGVGCFWHIQHEFIQAERDLLGRSDDQLTSLAGYAGGKNIQKAAGTGQPLVCYHNLMGVADYGKLGHGEVVGMRLPADQIESFGKVYFSLFNPKTKERVDPQDRGAEYRSLIGLPGGVRHAAYDRLETIATLAGFTLQAGQGNDPDTLGRRLVYVYDTNTFPFYQAELYHQYHNDFQSPPYGQKYNALADAAFAKGQIQITGCPDKV